MSIKLKEAQKLFQQNELQQALNILNECMSENAIDSAARQLRARIHYKMQNWGDAMNDYAAVLETEPDNQEAKSGLEMARGILGYFTPDMFNP